MRSFLYTIARMLGDLRAVTRGTIVQRIEWKAAGRAFGAVMRRIIKYPRDKGGQ